MDSPASVVHSPTHRTRCRSAGSNTGSKAKLFQYPSSVLQRYFGSEAAKGADNPRSFLGNLVEKAESPGPGAYQLRPRTAPMFFPGQSITGESSMFMSGSSNHVVDVRKGPGPAYYTPKPSYDQQVMTVSQLDGRWLV
jgi:hypothetical protein